MISALLKESTKQPHLALEKKIIAKLKNVRSEKDYSEVLQYFYQYFSTLEQHIAPYLTTELLPDSEQRRKAELLANDIAETGGNTVFDSANITMPQIENEVEALGALYVMEGSTLGGPVIVNMLRDKMGITNGISFFNGYGDDTQAMWQRFVATINNRVVEQEEQEQMIAAANDTFLQFSNLIHD